MAFWSKFHQCKTVVLQCHDHPDADSIACAFALYRYFESRGIAALIIYGGFQEISKPNLVEFVKSLNIPLRFVGRTLERLEDLPGADPETLLITVDCQYGAGNVTKIKSGRVGVIDHHRPEDRPADYTVIEPYLGSCSTVVWRLLCEAGFDWLKYPDVSTALYYGLYTDTNNLAEIRHPLDKDMLESLRYDEDLIKKLKGRNLTKGELLVAGRALHSAHYDDRRRVALFMAEPCDPNILGFINDLTLQVDGIEVCAGFCEINGGVKLSVRSSTNQVMADELATHLCRDLGNGGGTREKAGGFLRLPPESGAPREFILRRLNDYFDGCDHLWSGRDIPDPAGMKKYIKKRLTVGYAVPSEIYPAGTEIIVRTLEGDAVFTIGEETLLMVGPQGEPYPMAREVFEKSYERLDGPFAFDPAFMSEAFYEPSIRDTVRQRPMSLIPYLRPCRPTGEKFIQARPLERSCKVFSPWYPEGYMSGLPGDYLAARGDDPSDMYIVKGSIFRLTYSPVD